MSDEAKEPENTPPPASLPAAAGPASSGTVAPAPTKPAHGHGHPHLQFRFLEELKRRNVGRIAILYLVVCWVILEPVHVIFHMLEIPVWANRLVIILMALGFPVAVIFAWVYEITPQGLKPTAEVDPHQSIRGHTGQRLNRAIIIVLLLAVTYFAFDKFWLSKHLVGEEHELAAKEHEVAPAAAEPAAAVSEKSVAVLPFVDMSEKKDQEYFSDGLSEELIDRLGRNSDLKVIARTSSFQFKGKNGDTRSIGQLLGVAHLLEGSVRTSGKNIRVSTQLIRAVDGSLRWSETYERKIGDIFALQDEIAGAVDSALHVTMDARVAPAADAPLPKLDAYDALLQGRYWYDRDESDNSIASYQTAIKLDPGYALAWSELARAYTGRAFSDLGRPEDVTLTRQALDRAFAINPNIGVAHAALGLVNYFYDWKWSEAEAEFRKAHELDPANITALRGMGRLLETLGRSNEAIQYYREALSRDPLSARTLVFLASALADVGSLGEAEAITQKVLKLYPAGPFGIRGVARQILRARGNTKAALEAALAETNDTDRIYSLPYAYWAAGHREDADFALRELEHKYGNKLPYAIACNYGYRGDSNAAFHWLDRAYQQRDFDLTSIKLSPCFRSLHSDARFGRLLLTMGLPQ
jgi:adenylate cyclase